MKAVLDFIPMLVFFYFYKTVDPKNTAHPLLKLTHTQGVDNNHILAATAALILTTILIYGYLFISQKFKFNKQQLFVLVMTVVFGGLTLALSDDYYIRLKAVLINLAFAFGFLLSPFVLKEPLVKRLFASILALPDRSWRNLNLAWAGLFLLMAALHGFFAFVLANGRYWGEFTAFGDILVMMTFVVIMFVLLRKHFIIEDSKN